MSGRTSDEVSTDPTDISARVVFVEPPRALLVEEVAAALYDFSILYEVGLLGGVEGYPLSFFDRRFEGPWVWTRNARRIAPEHKLIIRKASLESPLEALVAIPGAVLALGGGLWAIIQAWERVLDRPINRQRLRDDARRSYYDAEQARLDYEDRLRERGLAEFEGRVRNRVRQDAIRPNSIEFED